MSEQTLQDLPAPVRDPILRILEVFVESGPQGLADRGLFSAAGVCLAEQYCADFGGKFRVPPPSAPVFAYSCGDVYTIDLPLWVEGENDRSDLFIFLEVDPVAGTARMTDLYVP